MLDVTITLDRFGLGTQLKPLVRIVIANDGKGTPKLGNYVWWVSHQEHYYDKGLPTGLQLAHGDVPCWKHGTIKRFQRRWGAAVLLARVMRRAFP